MSKVLILGAGGQIAQQAIPLLLEDKNVELTLFLRHPKELPRLPKERAIIVHGDVLKYDQLEPAVKGQDVVYANLAGEVDKQAANIIKAMHAAKVKRLIFIASLGIYDEVPGEFGKWNHRMVGQYLKPYVKAAELIEASDLEYTIIRPAWLTDNDETDYETTEKGEPFKGTEVSRKSVAALVTDLVEHPRKAHRKSLGINKPGTDGDKPSWY
ncbi:SDR family oxidoreductase [Chitinophaga sp. Cy-1792]|uniref:SDR family oxidoreductase n=1 Tax=Chitinophaga sp. Cy-1792 TaxID=2608339 RepID=UPI00141E0E17|nr:SDR family oxidoreductase [Chitinophaga sp. Cy-1792]NIG55453.1 SDR family oxidoreductase [Chitinophaga sp. Cy-1792]